MVLWVLAVVGFLKRTDMWKKIIKTTEELIDKYDRHVPVFVWIAITLATFYMDYFPNPYERIYDVLSHGLGIGLLWMPGRIREAFKNQWGEYSIGCLFGISAYLLVNLIYATIFYNEVRIPDHPAAVYMGTIQAVGLMGATCFSILVITRKYRKVG